MEVCFTTRILNISAIPKAFLPKPLYIPDTKKQKDKKRAANATTSVYAMLVSFQERPKLHLGAFVRYAPKVRMPAYAGAFSIENALTKFVPFHSTNIPSQLGP